MSRHPRKTISRRQFIKAGGSAAAAAALAACARLAPTPTPAPTPVPATPTAAAVATKPTDRWAIYPMEDPRHWMIDKLIEPAKVYKDLVITQNYYIANTVFKPGEGPGTDGKARWVQKVTGVDYKAVWSGTNFQDYWPTALASGDLAELLTNVTQVAYVQLREADRLADISEIWDKVASPLTKKKKGYPNDNLWWKIYPEKDGRFYGFPMAPAETNGENILWVRKDWLDKVKLSYPKTLEELEAVGKAFIKEGLSKYGVWINKNLVRWGSCDWVFGAYGTIPQLWRRGSDGKLSYSSLEPAQKDALAHLARWYKEGFLDPEYLAAADMNKDVAGNRFGLTCGAWWWSVHPMRASKVIDPTANWVPGHTPTGPGGKRGHQADPLIDVFTCFRKGVDPVKVEAFLVGLNFFYEIEDIEVTGHGANILSFLGYDYDIEGDKLVLGKFPTEVDGPGFCDFQSNRYPEIDKKAYLMAAANSKLDQATLNPLQQLYAQDPQFVLAAEALTLAFDGRQYRSITDYYWPIPVDSLELYQTLTSLEAEAYAKIITGKEPVSYFDTFVQEWRKQGGDKLTSAINAEDAKHA